MENIVNDLSMNNSCIQFLCTLPEDTNPLFSKKIGEFINENSDSEYMLRYILEHTSNVSLKFNAFYSLMVLYRKQKDVSKAEKIAKKYNNLFKDKPLYLYQMSSIYKKRLTKSDAILAIEYARQAKKQIEMVNEKYPGFYHNLADVIALAYENKLISGNELLEEGLENITKALAIDYNYAKYYCTLGRLQILEGNYNSKELSSISFQIVRLPYNIQKEIDDLRASDISSKESTIRTLLGALPTIYN